MSERNLGKKNLVGTVVSDKMTNRCRSNSSTNVKHPLYKKIIKLLWLNSRLMMKNNAR